MMTEQRLREMEAGLRDDSGSTHWSDCEIVHPRCACRLLIAEVRRLQQERDAIISALAGVVRVADRKTTEFDAARSAIAAVLAQEEPS
jgi:hypothetical protein